MFSGLEWTAFSLGFLHTLQPGHGKMLVAAQSFQKQSTLFRITAMCALAFLILFVHILTLIFLLNLSFADVASGKLRSWSYFFGWGFCLWGFLVLFSALFRKGHTSNHHHKTIFSNASFWGMALTVGLIPCPLAYWGTLAALLDAGLHAAILYACFFAFGTALIMWFMSLAGMFMGQKLFHIKFLRA
jgi:ABC-type nickel/cobalt efflux system permease component RcnA